MKKIIKIIFLFVMMLVTLPVNAKGFGVGKNAKGIRPNVNDPIITNNNGYAIGPDDNRVYLTFDCGYENGYTAKILDTLKEHNIKACFFITGHYLNSSPELVRRMINEGHLVGNHTYSHKDFTKSTNEEIINDIIKLEKKYEEITNEKMAKIVRPPRGEYDEKSQKLLASNGYKSIFWSLAFVDWNKDTYNGNHYSYNKVMSRIHPGAIILLHSVSKDNQEDLSDIIEGVINEGYVFSSINEL